MLLLQPSADVTLQCHDGHGELPLLLLEPDSSEPSANTRLNHNDLLQLFLVHLGEELDVIVLQENLCSAQCPSVHLQTDQKESTIVAISHDTFVVAKR